MDAYKKVVYEIFDAMNNIAKHLLPDIEAIDQYQLNERQKAILMLILRDPHLTISKIADYFGITKSAVSQAVSKLEQQGLITREINAHNRREITINLAKKGVKLKKDVEEFEQYLIETYISHLALDDLKQVERIMRQLEKMMVDHRNVNNS